ncbi:ATP phosphoribosyltransferase regulatory subunit [Fodinisporobacter ferrooxydans]|uniref:ATP phosphoribosyltransferase regulatory subunit n=1 Tax=Fodinisporobacter ferrooxydans TaxID=2901836 RepID=A0ABY4CLY4_9BACL|nr:ATP phosphoribosyltransferase regulatory subunit [Alicyclobacillaceae bacterium MYW30-H2]
MSTNIPVFFEKPQGVRDYLPRIAAKKRQLESDILQNYAKWGYEEVITPTLEYMDIFQNGSLRSSDERVFKFFERSGRTIVLRPDMTAPIARVVSSLLKDQPLPIRLSYQGSLFRIQELAAGRDAEFTQAGVELVGDDTADADAEVIALAVNTLKSIGITGFKLAIGNVKFLQAIFREKVQDAATRAQLQTALEDKNYVAYEQIVQASIASQDDRSTLLEIVRLRGGIDAIEMARNLTEDPKARQALDNLQDVWNLLGAYRVQEAVAIDLSVLLAQHYYTGVVFEGYAPKIGFPVCGGGRYDELYTKFGRHLPATGFMIGVDRILDLLSASDEGNGPVRLLIKYASNLEDRSMAIGFTEYLRAQGYYVSLQRKDIANIPHSKNVQGHFVDPMPSVLKLENGTLHTDDSSIRQLFEKFYAGMDSSM